MWKTFILFFILSASAFIGFTQRIGQDSNYRKFVSADTIIHNYQFYILELNTSVTQQIKNQFSLLAARKLSEFFYIIEKNQPGLIINNVFIKQLIPANNEWKISPSVEILQKSTYNWKKIYRFTIQLKDKKFLDDFTIEFPDLKQKISFLPDQNIISIATTFDQIQKLFLNNSQILFVDVLLVKPKGELGTPGFDLSANKVNVVQSQYPSINGLGQRVSIKEDYYDTTDIDLKGRLDYSPLASQNITDHANFIATIIAGAGNSAWYAKGVAWGANVSSSSFEQVLPDDDAYYLQQNISVQNHSYGTLIENDYGVNAVAFDKSANDNEALLHVFSSGNSGSSVSNSGPYTGIAGFANITGNFKMAKNILTVGAVDSFGVIAPLSSKGPAYDGRIKPELVAFQKNGTSEAAALVSGAALLLQQYYKTQYNDSVLPSALAKAILINTADDVNNSGPDYTTGFGNMNAAKAINLIRDHGIFEGRVKQDSTQSFSINVPSNVKLLKVTLAWNDTAASAFVPTALVNDVDLEVSLPASGTSWKPWVLNSVGSVDSLNSLAKRKKDSLNNIEQVTIPIPSAGNYQINIKGYNLPIGFQKYYVVYSLDTLNTFKWQRLTSNDFAEGGTQNILRWENSLSGNGDIEFSYATATNWLAIAFNVDLSKNYFYWNTPDTISRAVLRMKVGNIYFYSDTFLISNLLNPKVGFICNDSILVYWNKAKGINEYEAYKLGPKYMEPILKTADTSLIISKNILGDKYVAIAPILPSGSIAPKSYAFDYTLQGAGCYINAFFAEVIGSDAILTLSLGTLYEVDSISFEKQTASGFVSVFSSTPTTELEYVYHSLSKGISYFRAKIILHSGQIIYSPLQAVFYVEPGKYLLLPVPVQKNNDISLYTTVPDGETISIADVMGRIILRKEILFTHEILQTSRLQRGEYFYRITKKGVKVYAGKIIIL